MVWVYTDRLTQALYSVVALCPPYLKKAHTEACDEKEDCNFDRKYLGHCDLESVCLTQMRVLEKRVQLGGTGHHYYFTVNRRLSNARRQQTYWVNFHCLRSSEHTHNSENNGFTR